jgi:hypothetical protein
MSPQPNGPIAKRSHCQTVHLEGVFTQLLMQPLVAALIAANYPYVLQLCTRTWSSIGSNTVQLGVPGKGILSGAGVAVGKVLIRDNWLGCGRHGAGVRRRSAGSSSSSDVL